MKNSYPTLTGLCCYTPLIRTTIFPRAELFCRKCKKTYGVFDVEPVLASTKRLEEEKINDEWFRAIAKNCIPVGSRRRDCSECRSGGYHLAHASEEEIEKSRAAYSMLMKKDD